MFLGPLREGAKSAGRSLDDIDVVVGTKVAFTDDIESVAEAAKPGIAFQFGAMGTRNQNFYADAYRRQGWADEVSIIQNLWLEGKRKEAREEVSTELALAGIAAGSPADVETELIKYKEAGVNTIRIDPDGETVNERLDTLEEVMAIINRI